MLFAQFLGFKTSVSAGKLVENPKINMVLAG
jgi:hypothetical protein